MKMSIKRPEKRLHSGQWRAICGVLVMVCAISIVWAILASVSLWQRDRDLADATEELMFLREDLRRLEQQGRPTSSDAMLDDYLSLDDMSLDEELADPTDPDDPFAIFEEELGITLDEE